MKKIFNITLLLGIFIILIPFSTQAKNNREKINLPTDSSQLFEVDNELYNYGITQFDPYREVGFYKSSNGSTWASTIGSYPFLFGRLKKIEENVYFLRDDYLIEMNDDNSFTIGASTLYYPFNDGGVYFKDIFHFQDHLFLIISKYVDGNKEYITYKRDSYNHWDEITTTGYIQKKSNQASIIDIESKEDKVYMLVCKAGKKYILLSSINGGDWNVVSSKKKYLYFLNNKEMPILDLQKFNNQLYLFTSNKGRKKARIYKIEDNGLQKIKYKAGKNIRDFRLFAADEENQQIYTLAKYKTKKKKDYYGIFKSTDMKKWTLLNKWKTGGDDYLDEGEYEKPQLIKYKDKLYLNDNDNYIYKY